MTTKATRRDADGWPLEFTLDSRSAEAFEAEAARVRAEKLSGQRRPSRTKATSLSVGASVAAQKRRT